MVQSAVAVAGVEVLGGGYGVVHVGFGLLHRFGQTSMLRASLAPYNTLAECETFVASLRRAIKMLR